MSAAHKPLVVLSALALLVGCRGTGSDPSRAPDPSSSPPTLSSTTQILDLDATPTSMEAVMSTVVPTTNPKDARKTPSTTPSVNKWATQQAGEVALDAFVGELAEADRYRVDRHEQLTIAGKSLVKRDEFIVDLEARRVGGTVFFETSDREAVEIFLGDADMSLEDLETELVMDQSGNSTRILMTFPHGWDGKWLKLSEEDAPLPGAYAGVAHPEVHAASFREVANLPVSGFTKDTGTLQFEIPPSAVASWIPNRIGLMFRQGGVNLASAATATGEAVPITDGIGVTVDVTPVVRSLAEQLSDQPELAQTLSLIESRVTVRVRDLGTDDVIFIPAEEDIVDEPPVAP